MPKIKRVKEATRRLYFIIGREAATKAMCKDPERCVIAQALGDALGDMFEKAHVGPSYTKLFMEGGRVVRYETPEVLRDGLKSFDATGKWKLPEGRYFLKPPSPSNRIGAQAGKPRTEYALNPKRKGGRRPKSIPSRRVGRVRQAEIEV